LIGCASSDGLIPDLKASRNGLYLVYQSLQIDSRTLIERFVIVTSRAGNPPSHTRDDKAMPTLSPGVRGGTQPV